MRAPVEPQLWWVGAAGGGRRNARPPEMQKRLANAAVCVSRGVRAVARELPTVREPICVCMRAQSSVGGRKYKVHFTNVVIIKF